MKEIDFYHYCPNCKGALTQKSIQLLHCPNCKKDIYLSPKPCVGAIIIKDGKILFTQRARDPQAGKWDLPGGFVDYEDDLLGALGRELTEELGVELKKAKYLGTKSGEYDWKGYTQKVLVSFFECEISGTPQPADDVAAIEWHSPEDYRMICWPSDREIIKKFYLDK